MNSKERRNELKRASIEIRTLAIADKYVHGNTLALTNAMDFYTLANLVRNLDDVQADINVLSLYRMDLNYNYAHEVFPILFRFSEVVIESCEGTHVHAVIAGILEQEKINRLYMSSQVIDPQVDVAFERGLLASRLQDLSLTIEMLRDTAVCLCAGINGSTIKRLTLDQCEIYMDAVEILSGCFEANETLEILKVEHCRLRDDEVAEIVRAVKHHPTLLELSVRLNYAHEEAIDAVAELLKATPRLRRLDLAQQNPGVLDLSQIAEALFDNCTLEHLNLQENYLNDMHIEELVRTLSVNETLRELNLENCELKDAGLAMLVDSIGAFPGLTHLWLKENNFKMPLNEEVLSLSLKKNFVLHVLDLDDEDWIPASLKYHMFLNRAGQRFLAPDGTISLSLWPTLFARVQNLCKGQNDDKFQERDVHFDLLRRLAFLMR